MKSKHRIMTIVIFFVMGFLPFTAAADFDEGNLIVVNDPSAMSAGIDYLAEFNPAGVLVETLVPQSQNITGMSRVVFDPESGNVFYSISSWPNQVFEIREIDSSGNLIETHAHPDFGSGNLSMAMNKNGDLYIANDQFIYVKEAGQQDIVKLFPLPYTGIGDLAIDSMGNLYLSDPFISDVVYKIFPDGTYIIFADDSHGVDSPYGIAVDENDNVYVANNTWNSPAIIKVTQSGQGTVFSTDRVRMGILDMTFNNDQVLYTANREDDTIYTYDEAGNATLFANGDQGLFVPSSMAFVIPVSACNPDTDSDGDIDGFDLAAYVSHFDADCLTQFAALYGN